MEHEEKQDKKDAEEVEEQAARYHIREDSPADESQDSDDEGGDSDVDEQRFANSDASLKRSVAPIHGALATLR